MSSRWVDANGNQWRFSAVGRVWQTQVNGTWTVRPLPPGGLSRASVPNSSNVVVVETMGPRGERGEPGPPGTSVRVSEVLPPEYQDGVNDTFPLSVSADLSQAFQVHRNGLLEVPGLSYAVTPTHVTFTTPPLDDDVVTVTYQKAQ